MAAASAGEAVPGALDEVAATRETDGTDGTSLAETMTGGTIGVMTGSDMTKIVARDKERDSRQRKATVDDSSAKPPNGPPPSESAAPPPPDPDADGEIEEGEDMEEDEMQMMAAMGFGGFDSTKGKTVTGNQQGAANVKKQRTWRQYMNRKDFGPDASQDDLNETYEMTRQSQTEPLLASSTSATFGDDVYKLVDAESRGGAADVKHSESSGKVCSSTITFMFDGDRGLMADLALIAQLAGLAREQRRTFLIDDRLWTRGKDIRETQPGPEPGCLPPPLEELVACPRLAKHWLVTPLTAKFHFGHSFSETFEDPYARSTERLKPIFTRAFNSFESFIILSDKNIRLLRQARSELRRRIQLNTDSEAVATYMGAHIRRGDRKAMSWEFVKAGSDGYVPIQNYVDAVQKTWSLVGLPGRPHVYVASDDPVSLDEFTKLFPGYVYSLRQWGIDGGRAREGSVTDAAEELAELASPSAYVQSEWMNRTEEQRIRLTRGMIVEMALLSELWDDDTNDEDNDLELIATACTLTSNVCKMAAVGLGWARSLGSKVKSWVEIDNRNNIEPEWEAFELI
ncbi:unnamed protein product [Rhizoctonia solani]|uniref:U4/U6.U5 small nuclear ribonucleoprotein 27kDa protein domain-containing protein n=1 Tax=Rhizoctonia solani TaxID=456999 RepID=A0A8H3AW12_9AGAM|nr:unnamed protein product [Rhizoctonia solani]